MIFSKASLKDKVVWITGASSGIGEHLAYTLSKAGCKLTLSARREKDLERVKAKCLNGLYCSKLHKQQIVHVALHSNMFPENSELKDADIQVLPLDVCNIDDHEKAFNRVLNQFGRVRNNH